MFQKGGSAKNLDRQGVQPRKHTFEDRRELNAEKDGTFIL
jgi:hypothetical protein